VLKINLIIEKIKAKTRALLGLSPFSGPERNCSPEDLLVFILSINKYVYTHIHTDVLPLIFFLFGIYLPDQPPYVLVYKHI
jgi:hypothetical protein